MFRNLPNDENLIEKILPGRSPGVLQTTSRVLEKRPTHGLAFSGS